jgi:FKBP-type peptidyl-prolyl cis-trans isomerase
MLLTQTLLTFYKFYWHFPPLIVILTIKSSATISVFVAPMNLQLRICYTKGQMEQNKNVAIVGTVLTVLVIAGIGGFLFYKSQHKIVARISTQSAATTTKIDGSNIPLNQVGAAAESGGGLSVGSGSATGQLSPGNQSGTQSSQSSSKASSTSSQGLDPSTFEQYDKYKNEQHALFGEMQAGTGDTLTAGKKAAVYYKGWLTNGQMFDQSRAGSDGQLQPFVFQLGAHQVIPGWEEATAGMKVGGTRLLIVPPAVGYGSQAQSGIPANSVLVFQVQLVAVQ